MKDESTKSIIKRIAFIGNYLPRQCGIATFTTDLCEAIAGEYSELTCIAIPVNDIDSSYAYPPRVRFELKEGDINSYRRAADFLNINRVDIVCLQFEYGIFGGRAGSHILALLRELRMPIVTTLHTIPQKPDHDQLRVLEKVAALSDRLVVMSKKGKAFLQEIYKVRPEKIDFIPHGIPDVPFVDPSYNKDLFGVEGKTVLLSFGLLSSNKGIETVIAALPEIVTHYPNLMYIILGATHPNVLKHEGEKYRLSLQWLAHKKGVQGHVVFYNQFVSLEELVQFISAADIYITPYLDAAQITSGTLAYTLGAGKAVISTPYWYAEEMLAEERGVLFPFGDSTLLAEQVIHLLADESKRHAMRKRAYLYGRSMIWPLVANSYKESFDRAREEKRKYVPPGFTERALDKYVGELPRLKLDHLNHMTDETGIFQHAIFTIPNYSEGYTTDDNARALLVSALLQALGNSEAAELAIRYMAFIWNAFNAKTGRFRNFMDYQHNWLEDKGSDDSHGRALWALGIVLKKSDVPSLQSIAGFIFEKAIPAILDTTSPRAWAFAILGINEYLQRFEGDRRVEEVQEHLAGRLLGLFQDNRMENWRWFETSLTYCNAALPHALLICGNATQNDNMRDAGLESLEWFTAIQQGKGGHFVPIGSNGFYERGGEQARFDQQPVEAQTMVSACLEAFRLTGEKRWREEARCAFDWFMGRNDLNLPIYDPTTGGCRDGLHSDRANENQGAESTLAFLQALLELRLSENSILAKENQAL